MGVIHTIGQTSEQIILQSLRMIEQRLARIESTMVNSALGICMSYGAVKKTESSVDAQAADDLVKEANQ